MQLESVKDSLAPKEGRPAIPAYMEFTPDERQCFQIIKASGRRHKARIAPARGDLLRVPIDGVDVIPLREAKASNNDKELLRIIRQYVQTRGLGLKASIDSLQGTHHTLPEGSIMFSGKVAHRLQGELDEIPLPLMSQD
jgi:hypothetical protein